MKLLLSSLIVCLFLFSGCELKYNKYSAGVTIERDSAIYSAMPYEIDEGSDAISIINTILTNTWYMGDDKWTCERNSSTCEVVDNDIYNFLVVIPIKSKDDLSTELRQHDSSKYFTQFFWEKCEETSKAGTMSFTYKQTVDSDGYYHYKLYATSTTMKAGYGFDDIKDICISYDKHERKTNYRTDYTSNTITIKAQEIKDMLDNLGIVYE